MRGHLRDRRSMRISGRQVLPESQDHPPPLGLSRHLLQLFPEPLCSVNKTGMNSGTSQYGTLAEWLQSDVFIVFVVVAVVLGLVLGVVCWVLLRQRRCTQRLTEIEIHPAVDASAGQVQQHRFSLKIRTDQRHASELLGILADHLSPTESAGESTSTHHTSAGVPVSKLKALPNQATPSHERKTKDENIGVTVITSQTAIPGVFIASDYNSSNESNQNESDDDGDESD